MINRPIGVVFPDRRHTVLFSRSQSHNFEDMWENTKHAVSLQVSLPYTWVGSVLKACIIH